MVSYYVDYISQTKESCGKFTSHTPPFAQDVPPPEVKRRRKRQLVFFDLETQIPQEVLQQQIDDPKTETRSPPLPPPSSHRMLSAAELLNNPCTCQ